MRNLISFSGQNFFCLVIFALIVNVSFSQQQCDESFSPTIDDPLYTNGKGPKVFIDQAHFNFHTKDGRYCGFRKILEADGYTVEALTDGIKPKSLRPVDVLVISNSLNRKNQLNEAGTDRAERLRGWRNPVFPAFAESEEENLVRWVEKGGSLLLIADHHPFPGAIMRMARQFGIEFSNGFGFADYVSPEEKESTFFFTLSESEEDHRINGKHPVFKGLTGKNHEVDKVVSFTGSTFRSLDSELAQIEPLLLVKNTTVNLETDIAWDFTGIEPKSAEGWLQGAAIKYGKGRVIVLGEAAMLTAQSVKQGDQTFHMGVSAPFAEDNLQFVRNLLHWLDGSLGE